MRPFLIQFCLFLAATALLMEAFFQVSGLSPDIPYARYDAEYSLTLSDRSADSVGWYTYGKRAEIKAPWRINAAGWNSAFDFHRDPSRPLVAVVGDSYVENLYCAPEAHLDYQMANILPDPYRVYNFGRRGLPMSHFVPMTAYVKDHFEPAWIVYLINHRNLGESVARISRGRYFLQYDQRGDSLYTLPPQPYHSSQLKRILSYSATFRYVSANFALKIKWPKLSLQPLAAPPMPPAQRPENQPLQRIIARRILQDLASQAGDSRVLFVLHPNRPPIYEGTRPAPESRVMAIVRGQLDTLGLPYLSLNPAFVAAYDRDHTPFEFESNEHWTPYANRVAAQAIATHLQSLMEPSSHHSPSTSGSPVNSTVE
jgi:hypothetical protein